MFTDMTQKVSASNHETVRRASKVETIYPNLEARKIYMMSIGNSTHFLLILLKLIG